MDGRNPAPVDRWLIPLFIGFQPSFWWCRIFSILFCKKFDVEKPPWISLRTPMDFQKNHWVFPEDNPLQILGFPEHLGMNTHEAGHSNQDHPGSWKTEVSWGYHGIAFLWVNGITLLWYNGIHMDLKKSCETYGCPSIVGLWDERTVENWCFYSQNLRGCYGKSSINHL